MDLRLILQPWACTPTPSWAGLWALRLAAMIRRFGSGRGAQRALSHAGFPISFAPSSSQDGSSMVASQARTKSTLSSPFTRANQRDRPCRMVSAKRKSKMSRYRSEGCQLSSRICNRWVWEIVPNLRR